MGTIRVTLLCAAFAVGTSGFLMGCPEEPADPQLPDQPAPEQPAAPPQEPANDWDEPEQPEQEPLDEPAEPDDDDWEMPELDD